MNFLIIAFVLANLLAFAYYIIDKRKNARNENRTRNAILLILSVCGGVGALLGIWLSEHKSKLKKFQAAVALGLACVIIFGIHVGNGLTVGNSVQFVEMDFHSTNWPAELNGYRIAFMTDIHLTTDEEVRELMVQLNEMNIDLLLLGGDFAMRSGHYRGTIRELSKSNATDGIFGVDGNHDNYSYLFAAMRNYGIVPLDNTGQHIREGFFLAGVQDLWNRSPNIEQAISNAEASNFTLLLTHNPDVSMRQSTEGIDLILAGHTHGGHITFFGLPIYLWVSRISAYRARFGYGFAYSADGVPVFTSRGTSTHYGYITPIPRIFARPEVVIFTMYNG